MCLWGPQAHLGICLRFSLPFPSPYHLSKRGQSPCSASFLVSVVVACLFYLVSLPLVLAGLRSTSVQEKREKGGDYIADKSYGWSGCFCDSGGPLGSPKPCLLRWLPPACVFHPGLEMRWFSRICGTLWGRLPHLRSVSSAEEGRGDAAASGIRTGCKKMKMCRPGGWAASLCLPHSQGPALSTFLCVTHGICRTYSFKNAL